MPLRLLIALIVAASACGSQDNAPCPHSCPAAYVGVVLAVTSAADGGIVNGVEATLTGPQTEAMSCEPNVTATSCTWPPGPVTAGSYALEVTAAGFQSRNVSATVTVTPDPHCGCVNATLQPSTVTLDPA